MDKSFENETYGHENEQKWVGAWSTTPVQFKLETLFGFQIGLKCLTFRTRIQPTIGGEDMRITLSNEYGTGDVTVDGITAAKGFEGAYYSIKTDTLKNVTFGGKKSVTIPQGGVVTSDPVGMAVEALEPLMFSVYMKESKNMKTFGMIGAHTNVQAGNHLTSKFMPGVPVTLNGGFGEYAINPLIKNVDVIAPQGAYSAVFLGDSTLTNNIPLRLAKKLHESGIENIGILQQAVKGNRMLANGAGKLGMIYGDGVMNRLERDAFNQPGAKIIFLKAGVNDIIHPKCKTMKGMAPPVTPDEIIGSYKEIIEKAHERGIKVYLFTRTAWRGYTRNFFGLTGDDIVWSREIDEERKYINRWILSGECTADGVIDMDFLCPDPLAEELKPGYSKDGVHFTPAAEKDVVDRFPMEFFKA